MTPTTPDRHTPDRHTPDRRTPASRLLAPIMALATLALVALAAAPARAELVFTNSFVSTKTGLTVAVEADMTISGNTLTIVLKNNSPQTSTDPFDVISGFMFDIAGIPTLTYTSAVGTVADLSTNPNTLTPNVNIRSPDDLVANGWQFKSGFDNTNAWKASYGLATAGFSSGVDSFNGSVTGGLDYSIASGNNITASNLTSKSPLIYQSATFTLTGVAGLTEAAISRNVLFAFGTAPDTTSANATCVSGCTTVAAVPEPPAAPLLAAALSLLALLTPRRRT